MEKNKWENFSFSEIEGKFWPTDFVCPHCGFLPIKPDPKSLLQKRANESEDLYFRQRQSLAEEHKYEADMDLTNDWGLFSICFICDSCKEITFCYGRYEGALIHEPVEDFGDRDIYYYQFIPKFFDPGLKMIHIPDTTPDSVKIELRKAFTLYHYDKSACANKIRKAIERLMDAEGVDKMDSNGDRITLHDRICKFQKNGNKFKKAREKLVATKWIGNEGTHKDTTEEAVLDAFELFEDFLEEIYEGNSLRIQNKAREINRNRGSSPSQT